MSRRILLVAVAVLVLTFLARFAMHGELGLGSQEVHSATSRALPVKTVQVHRDEAYTVWRHYTGTVRPRRESDLGFELGGRVVSVLVEAGDEVRAGQALAQLDIRRLEARRRGLVAERAQALAVLHELQAGPRQEEIAQARSRIVDLGEQLKIVGIKKVRTEKLFKEQVLPEDAFDEAASQEKQLTARLEEARQGLEELLAGTRPEKIRAQEGSVEQLDALLELFDVDIENSTLLAPFDAVVGERGVDEGSVVRAGEMVVHVLERATPEAWVGVPLSMADSIVPGRSYPLEINGKAYSATAMSVLPEIDPATRCVTAIFALGERESRLFPGQIVRLSLEKSVDEAGMWVPTTALTRGVRGLWNCYALAEEKSSRNEGKDRYRVEHRQVEVLYADGDRLYVRGTLLDGERIVSEGTHRLVAGQPVTPIETQL